MNEKDLNDLIDTLIAEAAGEGPQGMRLVAETILNRSAIRDLSPAEVVRQPYQYTGYAHPGPAAAQAQKNPQVRAAARAALELAMQPGDPTGGSDHYYAPGTIAQPYWAGSMTPKGQFGGHAFFASQPLPPGELPEVATLLDVVPPQPHVTPSPDMRLMRNPAMSASAAPPPLPRPRPRDNTIPGADLALSGRTNPTTSRMTDDGTVLNPFFSDLTRTSIVGGMGSLTPGREPPVPASPFQRVTARNTALPSMLPPLPPPATREAPLPAVASPGLGSARLAAAATPPGLQTALNDFVSTPSVNGIGSMPSMSDMASTFGVSPTPGPTRVAQTQDRLPASSPGIPSLYGEVAPVGVGSGPVPPMPAMPSAALQTRRNQPPPLPIVRPGIGGPDIAPTPADRLDRPGVFGNTAIPLPGILGMIQSASKAMANSSGPFDNGADNLLYNAFRGGSFNTPGAADAIGTNGFLYAEKPGGGYVNVGRAEGYGRPKSNRPTLMGWLQDNMPSSRPRSSSSNQSSSRSLRPGDRRYNPDTNTWEIK